MTDRIMILLERLRDGPLEIRRCSICNAPLTLDVHPDLAVYIRDTRCDCTPHRQLDISDVVSWDDLAYYARTLIEKPC